MPSLSLTRWNTTRKRSLDSALTGHSKVGNKGTGIVLVQQQVIQGTVMLLSSQFQGYCRDLHSECVDGLVAGVNTYGAGNVIKLRAMLRTEFLKRRLLESGNPNPGNLGSDFNRFGLDFIPTLLAVEPTNKDRKTRLEELNMWRNAIGHHDFNKPDLKGRTTVTIQEVKVWREACEGLATTMDSVMYAHLLALLGVAPW